jgi:hypothetical protein
MDDAHRWASLCSLPRLPLYRQLPSFATPHRHTASLPGLSNATQQVSPSFARSVSSTISRTSHGAALGGSQVIPWGLRLACWLRLQDVLVLCTSPPGGSLRFSAGQDSKTPRLLPAIFITTGLAGVPPATCITLCNTPLRCTFRFELSAPVEGSPSPWRSRHSRLRPWPITGPSAAIRAASVRPFRAAPRRGFTRSPMGRNWGAFPPPVRVLVAQSQVL